MSRSEESRAHLKRKLLEDTEKYFRKKDKYEKVFLAYTILFFLFGALTYGNHLFYSGSMVAYSVSAFLFTLAIKKGWIRVIS
jgi:hypothetical protein